MGGYSRLRQWFQRADRQMSVTCSLGQPLRGLLLLARKQADGGEMDRAG